MRPRRIALIAIVIVLVGMYRGDRANLSFQVPLAPMIQAKLPEQAVESTLVTGEERINVQSEIIAEKIVAAIETDQTEALYSPVALNVTNLQNTSQPTATSNQASSNASNAHGPIGNKSNTAPSFAKEVSVSASMSSVKEVVVESQPLVVDLSDWELASIAGLQEEELGPRKARSSCKPPPGIPEQCCLASTGKLSSFRTDCRGRNLEAYASLRQQVLTELSPNNSSTIDCGLCRFVNHCYLLNLTWGIYGDSMTRQSMEDFHCSLLRQGYDVTKVHFSKNEYNITVSHTNWTRQVNLFFYQQYVVPRDIRNPAYPGNNPGVNAIMIAYGLHWSVACTRDHCLPPNFNASLSRLFGHLYERRHSYRLLLHREASAQHFDADGGDFFLAREANQSQKCVPYRWIDGADWRERYVQEGARQQGFKVLSADNLPAPKESNETELIMVPFFNSTVPLHPLHAFISPTSTDMDCTHFCAVPFMWWQLWRSLGRIVDREAASVQY